MLGMLRSFNGTELLKGSFLGVMACDGLGTIMRHDAPLVSLLLDHEFSLIRAVALLLTDTNQKIQELNTPVI
jgi:hypothetical protein